jgi:hypothetical protein
MSCSYLDHPAHRIVTTMAEPPCLLLVRVLSKGHRIYGCSLLCVKGKRGKAVPLQA